MDAESEVIVETETDTTEEVDKTDEVEDTADDAGTEDKPQYTEFEKKQFERAKLAEAENKRLKAELDAAKHKPQTTEKQVGEVTFKDTFSLVQANVHADDVDRVVKFAKDEGITVSEALKNDELKAILGVRVEHRKTAEVANTTGSKRTTAKVSDEQLVEKAERGEDVDPELLAEARMNLKKKK
jgi:hypothetical protein